jgi:hypothetical protein
MAVISMPRACFFMDSNDAEEQRQRERKETEEAGRRREEEERERRRREELEAARLRAAQAEAQNEAAAERAAAAAARAEAAETRRIAQRSAFKTAIVAIVACSAIAAVSVAGLAYYLGQRQAKQQAEAAARALALRWQGCSGAGGRDQRPAHRHRRSPERYHCLRAGDEGARV